MSTNKQSGCFRFPGKKHALQRVGEAETNPALCDYATIEHAGKVIQVTGGVK
jgi:hypothetical protein